MAWQFLRRVMHFVGGRVMARLAPRLLFFQYSNLITQEFDENRRKNRFYQIRTVAQMEILRLKMRKHESPQIGLSSVKDGSSTNASQASIFDVHGHEDLTDTATVFSTYFEDERDRLELIELDRSYVEDI